MAQPGASTSAQPEPDVDPSMAFLSAHANDASKEAFFQSGAEELAVSLLGQYLFFHDSNIAVRILETEAYPEGDGVFTKKFIRRVVYIKLKGGTLLACSPSIGSVGGGPVFKELLITAGPPDRGDLVLIRSCEPILGLKEIMKNRKNPKCPTSKKNLLIGPSKVTEGLKAASWPKNHTLYRDGRVLLFYGALNEGERVKRGQRILDTSYSGLSGTGAEYRFALATEENYKYSTKCGGLKDY